MGAQAPQRGPVRATLARTPLSVALCSCGIRAELSQMQSPPQSAHAMVQKVRDLEGIVSGIQTSAATEQQSGDSQQRSSTVNCKHQTIGARTQTSPNASNA